MIKLDRILVYADDNDRSLFALEAVQSLAAARDAKLTVVDVKPYLDAYTEALADVMPRDDLRKLVLDHRRRQLRRSIKRHESIESDSADVKVYDGVPFIEVILEVLRGKHDLIVKLAEGDADAGERVFGSTDMHLIRKSPVPVWLVNGNKTAKRRNVLAAIDAVPASDDSEAFNQEILSIAQLMSSVYGAKLHVVTAWHLEGENAMRHGPFLKMDKQHVAELLKHREDRTSRHLSELSSWFRRTLPHTEEPTYHRIKGFARNVIPTFVSDNDVDVLVMGSVGRADIPGLLIGDTPESVLSEVNCSVVTLKPKGFRTPVDAG